MVGDLIGRAKGRGGNSLRPTPDQDAWRQDAAWLREFAKLHSFSIQEGIRSRNRVGRKGLNTAQSSMINTIFTSGLVSKIGRKMIG